MSSPPFALATPVAKSVSKLLNPKLPVQLLRLNQQIHAEASETLYGSNHFRFIIGPTSRVYQTPSVDSSRCHEAQVCSDRTCRVHNDCYCNKNDGNHFAFEDNLLALPPHYLKLINRCAIHVQMPAVARRWESQLYSSVQARLKDFATCFGGAAHSLQALVVRLNQAQTHVVPHHAPPWPLSMAWLPKGRLLFSRDDCLEQLIDFALPLRWRVENVLEPLGTIFGAQSVEVVGASSEMADKLSRAMASPCLTCISREEKYGTRRAWVGQGKRKKRMQRYKLGRFHEPKYDWAD